jgi:hypothetical protein
METGFISENRTTSVHRESENIPATSKEVGIVFFVVKISWYSRELAF